MTIKPSIYKSLANVLRLVEVPTSALKQKQKKKDKKHDRGQFI